MLSQLAPRTPPESDGPSCSLVFTTTESTTGCPAGSSAPIKITHAFHPLFGEVIDFVERRWTKRSPGSGRLEPQRVLSESESDGARQR